MNYHVSLSDNARRDVDGILTWNSERAPQGAATWAERWDEVLEWFGEDPQNRTRAPESVHYDGDIFQVVFKTRRGKWYRALYVIREEQVIVIHVRGPGQDLLRKEELVLPDDAE